MSQQAQSSPDTGSYETRQRFLTALREVCYLRPEREQEILNRMRDSSDFYVATGRDAGEFLGTVIERHQEKHASLNLTNYGDMRTGKSYGSLTLGAAFDSEFTVDHVVFDLAQMQLLLPYTKPGSIYVIDDVRERYGIGSKAEVVNTQTFLETAAKSGTCCIFNSPTIKFTTGIKYFLEWFGYCDTFSLAMLYSKALVMKTERQVEVLVPIGSIRLPKPAHLQPLLDAYEAKKDAFIAEIRKKAGGSGTNIIDARLDYIRSEVDFSQCSKLEDFQDEIVLWDHTLPSNLVSAMARKIRRFLSKQQLPPTEEAQPMEVPAVERTEDMTNITYLQLLVEKTLQDGFERAGDRESKRNAHYATLYLIPEVPDLTYPDAVSYYRMEVGKESLRKIVTSGNKILTPEVLEALGEQYVTETLNQLLMISNTNLHGHRTGGPGADDVTVTRPADGPPVAWLNVKLFLAVQKGRSLPCTPESGHPNPPAASCWNKFAVLLLPRLLKDFVFVLEENQVEFSARFTHAKGTLKWLAAYLTEHFGGPDGG